MSPIILSAIGMILGVSTGLSLNVHPALSIPLLVTAISTIFIPIKKIKLVKFFLIFLVIGYVSANFATFNNNISSPIPPSQITVTGSITSVIENSFDRLVFNMDVISSKPAGIKNLKLRCYSLPSQELRVGDKISLSGKYFPAMNARNPGQFDFSKYLSSLGIPGFIKSYEKPLILQKGTFSIRRTGSYLREKATAIFSENLPSKYANMLSSLTFGRRELPEEIEAIFRKSGTSHILAASGFHISIMVFSTFWLLLWIFGNRKTAIYGGIIIALIYASIAGFTPSVTRALIMAGLTLGAMVFGRGYSKGSGLAGAVIILLLFKPTWILSPGFQLSFAASFALFIGSPIIFKYVGTRKWYSKLVGIIGTSVLINLLTMPIIAYHFHTFSVVSPLANIIAIPMATILIPLGALASILGWIIPPLGVFLCWIAWPLLILLESGLKALSNPQWAVLSIGMLPVIIWFPYYLTIMSSYISINPPPWAKKQTIRRIILVSILVFISFTTGAFVGHSKPTYSEVVFLDVGHGDSCFILTKCGTTILIDAGGSAPFSSFDPGKQIVIPFLRFKGINKLDYIIATHEDQDHIGGLIPVLSEFRAGIIFESGIKSDTYKADDLNTLIKNKRINTIIPKFGQKIKLDKSCEITFLGPAPVDEIGDGYSRTNNASVVASIEIDGIKILMTGDIQSEAMNFELRQLELLKSDIVKLPHHGGWSDGLSNWLTAVNPQYAISSDSSWMGTGAHSKTEDLLNQMCIPILSTANRGAITIIIKDGRFSFETFR